MPFRFLFAAAVLLAANLATADVAREETRDALSRERQELEDRAEALSRQQATAEALLKQQQTYLQALEREIQALGAADTDDEN